MKYTLTPDEFVHKFLNSSYKDNFTREALCALYDYLTNLEEDIGQELEFDVVGIACDYCQLDDEEEIRQAKEADAVIAELSDGTVLAYNF